MGLEGGLGRGDLAGAAHLELVSGVVQLRPEDAMFEAMLRGWRAQQAARGLREDTIASRERLVRRFLAFTNEYPWSWAGVPREPVVLPEPLAGLVLRLTAVRHGHASTGDQGTSPWLLPGGRPGQPISPYRVSERLRQIGIRPGPAHSTALFQLATELPAAILARMVGIHIDVAVAWQRASAGDWMTYAADISRRT